MNNFRAFSAKIMGEVAKLSKRIDNTVRLGEVESVDSGAKTLTITDGPQDIPHVLGVSPAIGDLVVYATNAGDSVALGQTTGTIGGGGGGASAPVAASVDVTTGTNVNDGTTAVRPITADVLGTGWSVAGNALTYTGSPSFVALSVNVSFISAGARVAPVIEIHSASGLLVEARTGYIRGPGSQGHETASGNISFVDTAPGTNPTYSIQSSRGSSVGTTTTVTAGSTMQAVAHL
jgi:hypothetical protein